MSIFNTALTLEDLPLPPPNKSGWPWTEQSQQLPARMPDGSEWPRISVVTPSYNQRQFIEETIRSVLLQGYPNLEYIIMDGGSTDGSVEIIQKYEKYLAYWVSERDRGQSHAINKGFTKSSGSILCWINSDDMLKPNALEFVARNIKDGSIATWLIGASEIIDDLVASKEIINTLGLYSKIRIPKNTSIEGILSAWYENWFPQQSTFWTRPMWEAAGPLHENLRYTMDFRLWITMFEYAKPVVTEKVLSSYRFQENAKCVANPSSVKDEVISLLANYFRYIADKKGSGLTSIENIGQGALNLAYHYCTNLQYKESKKYFWIALEAKPSLLLNWKTNRLIIKFLLGRQKTEYVLKITKKLFMVN